MIVRKAVIEAAFLIEKFGLNGKKRNKLRWVMRLSDYITEAFPSS